MITFLRSENDRNAALFEDLLRKSGLRFQAGARSSKFGSFEGSCLVVWPFLGFEAEVTEFLGKFSGSWVHSVTTGVDKFEFLKSQFPGIKLTNGRDSFSKSIAEWISFCCLYFTKDFQALESHKQSKEFIPFYMPQLKDKTLGFVGFGNIAKAACNLLRNYGCRLVACNRTFTVPSDCKINAVYKNWEDVVETSDYIINSLPATPDTHDFFGKEQFEKMQGKVFINVGRGETVDEKALVEALDSGILRGAALDVFKQEPLDSSSPLWTQKNLILSPHNCDLTEDIGEIAFNRFYEIWTEHQQSQCLQPFQVDLAQGY